MSDREVGERRERRVAPRFQVVAPVEFEDGSTGTGITENISVSGVLIEDTSFQADVRSEVTLRFSFYAGSFGTPFLGIVVRQSNSGFAVQFLELEISQEQVLREALPPRAFQG